MCEREKGESVEREGISERTMRKITLMVRYGRRNILERENHKASKRE